MQIMNRIFQLSGQAYGVSPNAYAVLGDNAVVIVDTGTNQAELIIIEENLAAWGLSDYPISHLLITHSHFDHSGNAHIFSKKGTKIIAGIGDAEGIECGDERTLCYSHEQNFIPCRVDLKVKSGDHIRAAGLNFDVIHLPGHSSGSMAYQLKLDGKTILFTGDSLMQGPDGQPRLGISVAEDFDPEMYLKSLKTLSKLNADAVLGGHFQPCLRHAVLLLRRGYRTGLLKLRTPSITN